MRGFARFVALLVFGLVLLPSAHAHLDAPVASGDEAFQLAPGEERSFPFHVHYHRLLGRIDVGGEASVTLAVYDEPAHEARAAGGVAEPFWRSEPFSGARGFNVLIDCCDGTGDERYHLVVAHAAGAAPADVRLTAKAAHDDLLVGMSGAEGDAFQNTGAFWVLCGVLAVRFGRGKVKAAPAGASRTLRQSVVWCAAPFALAALAGAWGAWRYGEGGAAGVVAAAAVVFPSFGAVVLTLTFAVAWGFAVHGYLQAARAPSAARGSLFLVGGLEALAFLATPLSLVPEYGTRVVLIGSLMTLPFALAVLVGVVHVARRGRPPAGAQAGDATA